MGKRRKEGNLEGRTFISMKNKKRTRIDKDLESSLVNPSDRSYIHDEIDDFEDARDNMSLQTAQKLMERKALPREQVLGIDGSSSDDDNEEYDDEDSESKDSEDDPDALYMEDDIVDEPKFQMPDEQAWGNKKHRYFGTDTTDEKIKWNVYNQDEEMAQLEEETTRKLQDRMAAELKDLVSDDLILQSDEEEKTKTSTTEDLVETDVSALSRSRKLRLLKRESPEFLRLIKDLKNKSEELQCILAPLMRCVKMGKVPEGPISQYIKTKYRLVLNYLSMISMYMLVKCSVKNVRDHPVIGRLAQYRQLLQELEPCDNKLAPRLKELLMDAPDEDEEIVNTQPKKKKEVSRKRKKELKILKNNKFAKIEEKKRLLSLLKDSEESKDRNEDKEELIDNVMEASSDEEQEPQDVAENEKEGLDPDEKRSIGYKISKNKGLMPYRNKDQRNPRVRYRNKYSKKLKRRKGQVQKLRKELNRYDGEITGIRSHAIKSIKIKS